MDPNAAPPPHPPGAVWLERGADGVVLHTFLTDDSGIGNPHAEPAIDCYLVTRLDQLLRRVIDSQISGRRIEPEKNEVIRAVGQYDAGKCILPPDFARRSKANEDA